ncbi:hypothetical protein M0R45_007776 [Rubus argutus]|uniref:Uncharacterized protein n=1 Tax=Rubus argutus TaxID=59490 RepID=A0AAW1XZ70_RUBAR
MTDPQAPPPRPLYKQNSWSPDILREETWQRRKSNWGARRHSLSKSVSDDDLEELKAPFRDNSVSTEKDDAEVVKSSSSG